MSSSTTAQVTAPRLIRHAEFGKRLEQACDAHPLVPPKHSGRGSWIVRELEARFNESISSETVRKWFAGETKPLPDKMEMLAELLGVDVAWLSLGVDPNLQPRERKLRNAEVDGAVNLVAGLIQMDGGHPAFPTAQGAVDLHAIIRGGKYDIHVSLGEATPTGLTFGVPSQSDDLVVLGVVRRDGFAFDIYEIPQETIEAGRKHGGSIEVKVSGSAGLRRIENFKSRL